jgi:hypothetical protein
VLLLLLLLLRMLLPVGPMQQHHQQQQQQQQEMRGHLLPEAGEMGVSAGMQTLLGSSSSNNSRVMRQRTWS